MQRLLEDRIDLWQEEEADTNANGEERDNVAFTSVLLSWRPHEVFRHKHFAVLILVEPEDRYRIQNRVHNARSANHVWNPRNDQPQVLVNQVVSDFDDEHDKCSKHSEQE